MVDALSLLGVLPFEQMTPRLSLTLPHRFVKFQLDCFDGTLLEIILEEGPIPSWSSPLVACKHTGTQLAFCRHCDHSQDPTMVS